MTTLQQRADYILRRVDKSQSSCWLYPTEGRGYLTVDGEMKLVYAIMYEATYGPVPEGLNLLHTCDTPNCCNPEHVEPGTQRENLLQAVARGRVRSASPVPGVSWQSSRERWLVMPRINGRKVTLYTGKDLFEAVCALRAWQARVTPAG